MEKHKADRHLWCRRTEASVINDFMRRAAIRILGGERRVKIIKKQQRFLICVDGEWAIKAKKLDHRLYPSNIPTLEVLDFMGQGGQYEIEGVPGQPTNLILGYQRQELQITESPVYLVCPNGKSIAWKWALPAESVTTALPSTVLSVPEAQPEKRRVRPKQQPAAEAEEFTNDADADRG